MDKWHLIAVEAENEQDAVFDAEWALDDNGKNQVWDTFSLRRSDEKYFDDRYALRFSDDPDRFHQELRKAEELRDDDIRIRRLFEELSGKAISVDEVPDTDFSEEPIQDKAAYANEATIYNATIRESLDRFLSQGVSALDGYERYRLGALLSYISKWLMKDYTFESTFFDGVEEVTNMRLLLDRCKEAPDRQWLVPVFVHLW